MKYFYVEDRTKRENVIAEMRINLRTVHNKYCEEKDPAEANVAIDLINYGSSEKEDVEQKMVPFTEIAVLLEGMEETYDESTDEEFFEAIEKLVEKMKEEMERV